MSDTKLLYLIVSILFFLIVADDMVLRGFDGDRRQEMSDIENQVDEISEKLSNRFENHVHRYYDGRIK